DADGDPLPPGVLARIGSLRLLHPGQLAGLCYTGDGTALASAGDDGVQLWGAGTGQLLGQLKVDIGRKDRAEQLAASPNGALLASPSYDGAVRIWCAAPRKIVKELPWAYANWLAFSPSGKTLVEGDRFVLRLWDMGSGKKIGQYRHTNDAAHFS